VLLVDANVLVYAVNQDAEEHQASRAWLGRALSGQEAVAFAWTVLVAFLRISTHPAVFGHPLTPERATDIAEGWLSAPPAVVVEPGRRHLPLLRGLLLHVGAGGSIVGDAHLAALALEHGATMVSFDRDFARFDGLTLLRPS
jgi:toxin-antitoxin system PIN domain toxin